MPTMSLPEDQLSPAEQYVAMLPLARTMIEMGIEPIEGFGLLQFDAGALLIAHRSGMHVLSDPLLQNLIAISRGEITSVNRGVRRNIDRHIATLMTMSRQLLARSAPSQANSAEGGRHD